MRKSYTVLPPWFSCQRVNNQSLLVFAVFSAPIGILLLPSITQRYIYSRFAFILLYLLCVYVQCLFIDYNAYKKAYAYKKPSRHSRDSLEPKNNFLSHMFHYKDQDQQQIPFNNFPASFALNGSLIDW